MVLREISHRRASFGFGVAAVVIAVVCFVWSLSLLEEFDASTEEQSRVMQEETDHLLAGHEDDIRKAMKGLGFNIHIYPAEQDLAEIYAQGFGSATMPQGYAQKLADSEIVTVNHLLPRLTEMVEWTERERTVLLFGVSGQVPIAHRGANPKKDMMKPVAEGKIVLGHELHRGAGWQVGDKVSFRGREFEIEAMHERRGGVDDITVWVSLEAVQAMLDKAGRINSILALECNCASLDRLGEIESELKAILPGIQIVEVESTALARASARNKAKSLRAAEQAQFVQGRDVQREARSTLIGILVPVVALMSMAWIAYLTLTNVGHRIAEIGTLRALGVGSGKVLAAFLMRAGLTGFVGAVIGCVLVVLAGKGAALSPGDWAILLGAVPVLACAAAWLPALAASGKDPAVILRND